MRAQLLFSRLCEVVASVRQSVEICILFCGCCLFQSYKYGYSQYNSYISIAVSVVFRFVFFLNGPFFLLPTSYACVRCFCLRLLFNNILF